jgi:hypothetical protein
MDISNSSKPKKGGMVDKRKMTIVKQQSLIKTGSWGVPSRDPASEARL